MRKCSAGHQGGMPNRITAGTSETAKFVLGVLRRSSWLKCEVWGWGQKGQDEARNRDRSEIRGRNMTFELFVQAVGRQ